MAQGFLQFSLLVFKISSDGVKVVSGVDFQSRDWADITTDIEVLQTRGEVVYIVVKIEKFHGTIKIVVRTEQRGERSGLFMVNKTKTAMGRDGELVTTQVIVSRIKVIYLVWGDGGLCASHEGVQLDSVLLSTHLIIERTFQIDNAGV